MKTFPSYKYHLNIIPLLTDVARVLQLGALHKIANILQTFSCMKIMEFCIKFH